MEKVVLQQLTWTHELGRGLTSRIDRVGDQGAQMLIERELAGGGTAWVKLSGTELCELHTLLNVFYEDMNGPGWQDEA